MAALWPAAALSLALLPVGGAVSLAAGPEAPTAERPGADLPLEPLPVPVAWLHIPKCGTSFANVLYHHTGLCPRMPQNAYLVPGTQWSDFVKSHPPKKDCAGSFAPAFEGEHYGLQVPWSKVAPGHVMAFFRQPEQRIISGWLDKYKDWPISMKPSHILEYAKYLSGCSTRMLTRSGKPCGEQFAEPMPWDIDRAVGLVRDFAFVGLTEEYDLSVCLFYATYGGNCTDSSFMNMRPGKEKHQKAGYNATEYVGQWTDPYDGPLYEEAKRVFWERIKARGVNRATCAHVCRQAVKTRPFGGAEKRVSLSAWPEPFPEYDWSGRLAYDQD